MIRLSTLLATVALAGTAFAAQPHPATRAGAVAAIVTPPPQQPAPTPVRKPFLRPELTLTSELVSFGDLLSGLPSEAAATPGFRAPALGETGTIQVSRIMEAARAAGIIRDAGDIESHGFAQVIVTRAARRLMASDLEAAVKTGLQERFGVDARALALAIDGGAPAIAIEPELTGDVTVLDLGYDVRSRRVQARLIVPGSAAMRLKPIRITGQMVDTVEVVVPRRSIARGETLSATDVVVERRPHDGQATELIGDVKAAIDKVARRALNVGMPLRVGDVQREEIVGKGDLVTIVYAAPGLLISMRGKAGEAGAMGDVVTVTNPQSKRVLQGTVSGPGRVSVQSSAVGRVASAP
ncbi:flagellar basal body P-ring formation chaperone FlgA [Bosea vaviloviae]|nr:flagellar basal body P-ring formation chaperone FlgA [Bosea vaviloviae]